MNWLTSNFNWNHAQAFLATAEQGSLSAAAKALRVSQPTLGRRVSAFEEALGVALFERSGRGLELTPSGLELMEHVKQMAEAANRFSLTATGKSEQLSGSVTITATEITAAYVLPPILKKLQLVEPEIEINLIASNTSSDLKRREADIAVRAYRPTQGDLIAKKVLDEKARPYASVYYIEKHGDLMASDDLSEHKFLGFNKGDAYVDGLKSLGLAVTENNFQLYTESLMVFWEMVKQGLGVGVVTEEIGDQEPLVQRVADDNVFFPVELWLTAHREVRTSRRIRTVFDFLDSELRKHSA